MNKLVEANKAAIVTASENICGILATLITMVVNDKKTYLSLTKEGVYSGTYLEERLKTINAEFKAKAATYEPKLVAELDSIEAAGHALETSLELTDADLASAMQILMATNCKIDQDTEAMILDSFQGNQAALRVIKSTFDRFERKSTKLDKMLFSIDEKMFFMRARVDPLIREPSANRNEMFNLRNDLKSLCRLIGAKVTEDQFSLGEQSEDMANDSLRKAMGLPPNN